MPYVWRTPGPWGPANSDGDLTPEQLDGNFWQAVQDIAGKAAQGVGISNFVVHGNQMTVVLTDHTLLGPYTLPVAVLGFGGEWQPNTYYHANTIITHGGATYLVLESHTSAATFDPHANDGLGNDFYGLLLENPALTIPTGGAAGMFLRKRTGTDLDMLWETTALAELSDVHLPSSPGAVSGDVLTFLAGAWTAAPLSVAQIELSELSDVSMAESPPPATGQLLTWNGLAWTNLLPAFNPTVISPLAGQLLVYDHTGVWLNKDTADIPVRAIISVFGSLSLDYSQGAVQRVVMTNGVTLTGVTNWPPSGQFGRLILEVRNNGAYTWTWPTTYHWPGGTAPEVSTSGRDIFTLTSYDNGLNVDGSVIGQNYL
jgi:hypothetical protein